MTRLLCLGDSITDCGRLFSGYPLGNGYVKLLSNLMHNTDRHFSTENKGIDGWNWRICRRVPQRIVAQ